MTLDLQSHLSAPLSRRRLMQGLGLTLVAGSPAFIAACGDEQTSTSSSTDEANDLKLVNAARALELAMVAGYTRVVSLLGPDAAPLGNQILAQEQAHATGLGTVVGDLGGTPPAPKSDADYERILGLGALRNQNDALKFAEDLEQMAIFSYESAIPPLTNGDLRATFVQIAANEAQHSSIVVGVQSGNDPAKQAPEAFVTGTKPTLELQ
jgi:hypothetical protein